LFWKGETQLGDDQKLLAERRVGRSGPQEIKEKPHVHAKNVGEYTTWKGIGACDGLKLAISKKVGGRVFHVEKGVWLMFRCLYASLKVLRSIIPTKKLSKGAPLKKEGGEV